MPSAVTVTVQQCVKQCKAQTFLCANITQSNNTAQAGMFDVTPFTAEWAAQEIIPNQLILGFFFFAWNAGVFPSVIQMCKAFVQQLRRQRRGEGGVQLNLICSFFFMFAFMTPFWLSGLIMPLVGGPLSMGLAYISILAAVIHAVKSGEAPNFQPNGATNRATRVRSEPPQDDGGGEGSDIESGRVEMSQVRMSVDCSSSDEYKRLLGHLRQAKTSKGIEDGLDQLREYVVRHMRIFQSDVATIAQQLRQEQGQGQGYGAASGVIPRHGAAVRVGHVDVSASAHGKVSHVWTEDVKGKFLQFMKVVNSCSS